MSETQMCAARIRREWGLSHPCRNIGKYEEDGKHWCGTHRPSAMQARAAKITARHDHEHTVWNADRAVILAKEKVITEARALFNSKSSDTDPLDGAVLELEQAEAELARLKGGKR